MVITVECSSCATEFPVDTDKVPEGGVYARCSECDAIFFVSRPEPEGEDHVEDVADEGSDELAVGVGLAEPADEEPEEPEAEDASADGEEPPPFGMESAADEDTGVALEEPEESSPVFEAGFDEPVDDAVAVEDTPDVEAEEDDFDVEPETAPPPSGTFTAAPPSSDTAVAEPDVEEVEEEAEDEVAEAEIDFAEPEADVEETDEEPDEEPEAEAEPAEPVSAFTFGRRDPEDKAKRLARVLVSDMIMYNPERHARALENGTLKEDFEDEIKKSWDEYVGQVGEEMADDTTFFNDALNEILARGQQIFP